MKSRYWVLGADPEYPIANFSTRHFLKCHSERVFEAIPEGKIR